MNGSGQRSQHQNLRGPLKEEHWQQQENKNLRSGAAAGEASRGGRLFLFGVYFPFLWWWWWEKEVGIGITPSFCGR